ncbi:hypothetical protein WN51_02174 [Melipona quadrifasciata]|uniref:Uncharacterized protein n=1 Tax=Melipona quadrifasciata TaxID=166423 RepID=A0A0M8ZTE0_9HYME|nr:hypothetical protein WN51_02174 [Melipona quadrifasciata]
MTFDSKRAEEFHTVTDCKNCTLQSKSKNKKNERFAKNNALVPLRKPDCAKSPKVSILLRRRKESKARQGQIVAYGGMDIDPRQRNLIKTLILTTAVFEKGVSKVRFRKSSTSDAIAINAGFTLLGWHFYGHPSKLTEAFKQKTARRIIAGRTVLFESSGKGEEDKGDAEVVNEEKMSQPEKREPKKEEKKKERLFVKGSRPQDARMDRQLPHTLAIRVSEQQEKEKEEEGEEEEEEEEEEVKGGCSEFYCSICGQCEYSENGIPTLCNFVNYIGKMVKITSLPRDNVYCGYRVLGKNEAEETIVRSLRDNRGSEAVPIDEQDIHPETIKEKLDCEGETARLYTLSREIGLEFRKIQNDSVTMLLQMELDISIRIQQEPTLPR